MFLKFRKIHWKAPVFSCKFCKIFKNTFFTKHLRATASDNVYLITLSAFSSPTILLSTIEFPIIDGEFGKWSHYSKCSHLCGGEIQNRTRNLTVQLQQMVAQIVLVPEQKQLSFYQAFSSKWPMWELV